MPSGSHAPEPSASLCSGTPKRITAGTPRSASSRDLLAQRLARVLHHAGQAGDRLGLVDALAHEQRGDRGRRRRGGSRRPGGAGPGVRRSRRSRRWGKVTGQPTMRLTADRRRGPRGRRRRAEATTRSAWGSPGSAGDLVGDRDAEQAGGRRPRSSRCGSPRTRPPAPGRRRPTRPRRGRGRATGLARSTSSRVNSRDEAVEQPEPLEVVGSTQYRGELDATSAGTPRRVGLVEHVDHARAGPPARRRAAWCAAERDGRARPRGRSGRPPRSSSHSIQGRLSARPSSGEQRLERRARRRAPSNSARIGEVRGHLGVEDQAVEVEHDRAERRRRRGRSRGGSGARRRRERRARRPGRRWCARSASTSTARGRARGPSPR